MKRCAVEVLVGLSSRQKNRGMRDFVKVEVECKVGEGRLLPGLASGTIQLSMERSDETVC